MWAELNCAVLSDSGSSRSCEFPQDLLWDPEAMGCSSGIGSGRGRLSSCCLLNEGGWAPVAGRSVEGGAWKQDGHPVCLMESPLLPMALKQLLLAWQPGGPEQGEGCRQQRAIKGSGPALGGRDMLTLGVRGQPPPRGAVSVGWLPGLSWSSSSSVWRELYFAVSLVVSTEAGRTVPSHCSTQELRELPEFRLIFHMLFTVLLANRTCWGRGAVVVLVSDQLMSQRGLFKLENAASLLPPLYEQELLVIGVVMSYLKI